MSMELVRRTTVLAGMAALVTFAPIACASGGDTNPESSAPSADSTTGSGSLPANGATPSAAAPSAPIPGVSVTTGVYTADQAARGHEVYASSCGQCHTMVQHSGSAFATAWNNRRLYDLFEIVHTTMPLDNPGGLSEQEYIDVIAYLLELNGVPAGKTSLSADAAALKGLRIDVTPTAGQ
jgi:mono/diheme cytochrome c family protein